MPTGVYKRTSEMYESRKGRKAWNKGLTKEIDCRVAKYAFSISKSLKGHIPWNKDRKGRQKNHSVKGLELGRGWNRGKKCPQLSGENQHLWKGGKSKRYKTGYYSFEYRQWRRTVFIRDEFTCVKCGVKHVYVTAHHIKSFSHYPSVRFDIDNGLTLCEDCHKKTDNYKGRA